MISAVIVAYKTPAELAAAVASLRAQSRPPDEIIVVDNGAAEGEPIAAATAPLAGVHIEASSENIGYGAACNAGARLARGEQLLFVNADVVLSRKAIEEMAARLREGSRIAVVGPRVMSGGHIQLSARAFPSLRTGVLGRRSLLTRLLAQASRYPREFERCYGEAGPVDWVSGACLLVRRDAFESVGGFDDRFWMYWEDADLCRRLHDAGWRVAYEPKALVHHATGASGTGERTIRAFHESAARFASRHLVRSQLGRAVVAGVLRARCWVVLHSRRLSVRES